MHNIDIDLLKRNKNIKYIYEIPNSFYKDKKQYVFVGDLDTEHEDNIFCFSLEDWFNDMISGNLLPYACSTLKKKYKIKELLNIYLKPSMLSFRKFILNCDLSKDQIHQQLFWAIQILDEFKINRYDAFDEHWEDANLLVTFLDKIDGQYKMCIANQHG